MGFLTDMNEAVRRSLAEAPPDAGALRDLAQARRAPRDLATALDDPGVSVIAEVKRASPSVGRIAEADPAARAALYELGGAAAVSVLTEGSHFGGSIADLEAAAATTDHVPVVRKDFILDPLHLLEARAAGADAVLLITASLSAGELDEMLAEAAALGLGVLLETHSPADLDMALATEAAVIGVNARDLETLEVDVDRALAMLRGIPTGRLGVLESGISTRGQVEAAEDAGAAAVLVGESLMRAEDPAAKIRELRGGSE
jgi:indole-3-glycerol phosphate synthase